MKFRFINLHLWLNRAEWSWIVWCWRWMFPLLVKTSENRWCLTSGNNTMTPYPTPLKRAVQIPPPRKASKSWPRIVSKDFILFFDKIFFNEGESNRKISEKEVDFTNHWMFVVRSSFLEKRSWWYIKFSSAAYVQRLNWGGRGKGVVLVGFWSVRFCAMKGTCFFTEDVLKNFLFGSTLEKRWPVLREHAFSEMNSLLAKFWWQRRQKSTPVISLLTLYRTGPCRFFFVSNGGLLEDFFLQASGCPSDCKTLHRKRPWSSLFRFVMKKLLKHFQEKCFYPAFI